MKPFDRENCERLIKYPGLIRSDYEHRLTNLATSIEKNENDIIDISGDVNRDEIIVTLLYKAVCEPHMKGNYKLTSADEGESDSDMISYIPLDNECIKALSGLSDEEVLSTLESEISARAKE